jgi:hypothetical protein
MISTMEFRLTGISKVEEERMSPAQRPEDLARTG